MTAFVVDHVAAPTENGRRDARLSFARTATGHAGTSRHARLAAVGFDDGFLGRRPRPAGLAITLKALGALAR